MYPHSQEWLHNFNILSTAPSQEPTVSTEWTSSLDSSRAGRHHLYALVYMLSSQEHPSSDASPGLRTHYLPRGKNAWLPCADMRSPFRRYLSPSRTTGQPRDGATYPACRR